MLELRPSAQRPLLLATVGLGGTARTDLTAAAIGTSGSTGDDLNIEASVALAVEILPSKQDEAHSRVHCEELPDGAKRSETGTGTIGQPEIGMPQSYFLQRTSKTLTLL